MCRLQLTQNVVAELNSDPLLPSPKDDKVDPQDEDAILQEAHPTYDMSLYIFSSKNRFRKACQNLIDPNPNPSADSVLRIAFSYFILVAIIASVIFAAIDTPLYRKQNPNTPIQYADMLFASVFGLEFLINIIANGVVLTPNAYFKDSWNYVDFLVMVFFVVTAFAKLTDSTGLSRAFRAVRALRPLRLLRRFKGLREIAKTLYFGLPRILDAFVLTLFFFVPYAIYGLTLFSGYVLPKRHNFVF